jgi:CubicO group peptidase (beta-lactamase class C family)
MNTRNFSVMRGIVLLVILVALSIVYLPVTRAQSETPDFAAIDAYVKGQVNALNLPGLALGIVQGNQIVHLQSFGIADPSGRPVTPQTPFLLASMTKSFTALAIMQLVEAGQVELDAPVQRYLPWFRVADEGASAQITVRHLLNQTSGLSTLTGNGYFYTQDTSAQGLENFVRGLSSATLDFPVGQEMEYSNANYSTLGLIVQTVSGETYEDYVKDHIFEPLDMRNSFASAQEAKQHGMATGYQYIFGRLQPADLPYIHEDLPAGRLISSSEDMGHYLIAYLNQGRYGNVSILSPEGMAQLWQRPTYLPDSHYAMGWYVGAHYAEGVNEHNGEGGNFHSYMSVAPAAGWGVVVLVNASHAVLVSTQIEVIGWDVTSMLLGQPLPEQPNLSTAMGIYIGTLVITLLQVLSFVWALFRLRRWLRQPETRPQGGWRILLHIVLPIVLNVLAGFVFAVGLPAMFGAPLVGVILYAPEWGYTMLLSGLMGIGWVVWGIATAIMLRGLSATRPTGIGGLQTASSRIAS